MLVFGVNDPGTQEKLLYEKDLTLAKAMKSYVRVKLLSHAANRWGLRSYRLQLCMELRRLHDDWSHLAVKTLQASPLTVNKIVLNVKTVVVVTLTGRPTRSCKKIGHLARYCRSKRNGRPVHTVTEDGSNQRQPKDDVVHTISAPRSADYFTIATLSSGEQESEWYETVQMEGFKMSVKLDTGAMCNVLPESFFSRIPAPRRHLRPGPRVRSYGSSGRFLNVLGTQTCHLSHRGQPYEIDFVVVAEPGQPAILGLKSCLALKLIQRVDAMFDNEIPSQIPPIVQKYINFPPCMRFS